MESHLQRQAQLYIIQIIMIQKKEYSQKIELIEQVKKNPVLYIDLVAKGTVDEKIIQSLRNKINIAREISGEELVTWI